MHPVNRYKQYVLDLVEVVTSSRRRERQQENALFRFFDLEI